MRRIILFLALFAGIAAAQESQLQADFRGEKERLHNSCSSFNLKSLGGCGQVLFTDHPLHIAVGSIAPQNGFAFGVALVTHYTPNESWRLSWNADAIASFNGSWRAGVYMKAVHTPPQKIGVVTTSAGSPGQKKSPLSVREYTVFNLYAQSTSLNKLLYYGEGPLTAPSGRSFFGMTETIAGGSATVPVGQRLHLSVLAHVNGRFPSLRGNHGENSPSIEQVYSEATAPGLAEQPAFLDVGAGLRLRPALLGDHLLLNYLGEIQQFYAPGASRYSFRRWTLDLNHEIPLYRTPMPGRSKETNGPDECAQAVGATKCPSVTRNRYGAVNLKFFLSESEVARGNAVPFYLQPTLGGSDINGTPALPSYPDYRFRAPNVMLFRERIEHSLYGPVGITVGADQGTVALQRGNIGFQHFRHSYIAGITVRAGGLPMVYLLYAWGGQEGTHTIFNVNTSLLGGSARPSLF